MARGGLVTASAGEAADGLLHAFGELREELIGSLTSFLGSREDAHDAAQETFLKCWRARTGLGQVRDLRAWIYRIGLNTARDLRRSAWRQRNRPIEQAPVEEMLPEASPPELLQQREALDRLRAALEQLRDEEREVFLLRQNSDLTYEEIAERTGRPIGTVKTQMRSALIKLRRVCGALDGEN